MPQVKEYTHKQRAVNFVYAFLEITNDSEITNIAKQSAIVALERNIENFDKLINKLTLNGNIEVAECFEIIRNDEKALLAEVRFL
jgi:hypothetical protein